MTNRNGIDQIYRVPFGGGQPVLMVEGGGLPLESWDGGSLYYVCGPSRRAQIGAGIGHSAQSLCVRPLTGGVKTEVIDPITDGTFAIGREGVYYIGKRTADGVFALEFFDSATSRSRQLGIVREPGMGLSVSPDGSIAYTVRTVAALSDLRLVEPLR